MHFRRSLSDLATWLLVTEAIFFQVDGVFRLFL
jgi:hypothetical protein